MQSREARSPLYPPRSSELLPQRALSSSEGPAEPVWWSLAHVYPGGWLSGPRDRAGFTETRSLLSSTTHMELTLGDPWVCWRLDQHRNQCHGRWPEQWWSLQGRTEPWRGERETSRAGWRRAVRTVEVAMEGRSGVARPRDQHLSPLGPKPVSTSLWAHRGHPCLWAWGSSLTLAQYTGESWYTGERGPVVAVGSPGHACTHTHKTSQRALHENAFV